MASDPSLPLVSAGAPLVSVVIPTYNGLPFIVATIESVRQQAYQSWELIICDNVSKDETVSVVRQYLKEKPDPRIRLLTHDEHLPMAQSWNRSLRYAQGEMIKVLPSDDILFPQCLETQVRELLDHPEVGFVSSAKEIIGAQGTRLFSRKSLPEGTYDWSSLGIRSLYAITNLLGEPAGILFRKELLVSGGDYDGQFGYFIDVDMNLRFLKAAKAYVNGSPLYQFRIHRSSASASSRKISVREYFQLLEKYEGDLQLAGRPLLRGYLAIKSRIVVYLRMTVFWVHRKSL